MPESVRVNVREAVAGAELCEPVIYGIRVYRVSVILREHIALVDKILPQA